MNRVFLILLLMVSLNSVADTPWYSPYDASNLVGETAWVCGHIGSAHHARSVRGQPTYINLGPAYPNQVFTIVIWSSDRHKFELMPERLTGALCVHGRVNMYGGTPQIVVRQPQQIRRLRD